MRSTRMRLLVGLALVAAAVTVPLTVISFASAGSDDSMTAVAKAATAASTTWTPRRRQAGAPWSRTRPA